MAPAGEIPYVNRWPRRRRKLTSFGDFIYLRGFPFRPYLHARIPRMTYVDRQLPQIIIVYYVLFIMLYYLIFIFGFAITYYLYSVVLPFSFTILTCFACHFCFNNSLFFICYFYALFSIFLRFIIMFCHYCLSVLYR